MKEMKPVRLDKWISDMTGITRSQAKEAVRGGRVRVDGEVARRPEAKPDPKNSIVTLDGIPLVYEEYQYLMMNKPAGVISATADSGQKTVLDLVENRRRGLFPVGRLDKDTTGLLLLTNDGALAHSLLSPAKHVSKQYYARLDGPVGEDEIRRFSQGLDIGDEKPTLPAVLAPVPGGDGCGVMITITEGRYHQVKRMAEAVGRKVISLKRISMGSLTLDESLLPGQYRQLTPSELEGLSS